MHSPRCKSCARFYRRYSPSPRIARKCEINFQSTSSVMTVISLPLAPPALLAGFSRKDRLRNWRTRSIWIDLKVSIKRIYSRSNTRASARREFLHEMDHVFHYASHAHIRSSLYRRERDSRERTFYNVACGIACDKSGTLPRAHRRRRRDGAYSRRRSTYKVFLRPDKMAQSRPLFIISLTPECELVAFNER